MSEPVCVQKAPYALELSPGDYWWCACGKSKKQPFCDGSHKDTGIAPVKFTITAAEKSFCVAVKPVITNRFATVVTASSNRLVV